MNKNVDIVNRELHFGKIRKTNGITLVALVVTIIILLILAGISIAQLTGNGLFEKAKLAKEKQENARIEEDKTLEYYENKINDITGSRDTITLTTEQYNSIINRLENLEKNTTPKLLWSGDIYAKNAIASLNDNIENYSYLLLQTKWGTTNGGHDTLIDVETIKLEGYYTNNYSIKNSHIFISLYDTYWSHMAFISNTDLIITDQNGNNVRLTKIYGIKNLTLN